MVINKIFRYSIIPYCLFSFVGSCQNSNQTSNSKRQFLIDKVVNAIAKYDTMELLKLTDTTYCFDTYGKDGFLYKINYAFNRIKVCGKSIDNQLIKTSKKPGNVTEYVLPFCRINKDSLVADSFDLLLSFADYENDEKIMCLDINIYKSNLDSTLPANLPKK